MREGLVGFSHTMNFFTLLHSTAAAFRGVDKLAGQAERHRFFTSALSSFTQPAHGQSHTTDRSNFDRNLVVGTADTAGLNFNQRTNIVQSVCEHFEGIFTRLVLDFFQSAIHDAFCNGFLAVKCENSYSGKRRQDADGNYLTTKNDAETHGFGLKLMNTVAVRYHSILDIFTSEDRIFTVQTALKLPKK